MQNQGIQMLHSEQDTQKNRGRIRRQLVCYGIISAIALAGIIASLIWRDPTYLHNANEQASQLITIAITLVAGAVVIFLWGMKMSPLMGYRRYLKEIRSGLTHDVQGRVLSVERDTTFRDSVYSYAVIINVGEGDDPEDERLLYWDAQLGAPPFVPEESVHLRAHGNDIIGIYAA